MGKANARIFSMNTSFVANNDIDDDDCKDNMNEWKRDLYTNLIYQEMFSLDMKYV